MLMLLEKSSGRWAQASRTSSKCVFDETLLSACCAECRPRKEGYSIKWLMSGGWEKRMFGDAVVFRFGRVSCFRRHGAR